MRKNATKSFAIVANGIILCIDIEYSFYHAEYKRSTMDHTAQLYSVQFNIFVRANRPIKMESMERLSFYTENQK